MEGKSGVSPSIMTAIPKGGSTSMPNEEAFTTDLNSGTVAYALNLQVPSGRNGQKPQLKLSYKSAGSVNSPFGVGWSLPHLTIRRRTHRGIPSYTDSDEFVLSSGEELVKVQNDEFRTRIESDFRRISKTNNSWKIIERNGTVHLLGDSPDSRLADLSEPDRIFAWFLHRTEDTNGNVTEYEYEHDSEWIRYPQSRPANQIYLSRIKYVNLDDGRFLNTILFDYDCRGRNEARPDHWTAYISGFAVQTNWRCRRIVAFTSDLDSADSPEIDLSTDRPEGPVDRAEFLRHGVLLRPFEGGQLEYRKAVTNIAGIRVSGPGGLVGEFPLPLSGLSLHLWFQESTTCRLEIFNLDGTQTENSVQIPANGDRQIDLCDSATFIRGFHLETDNKPYLIKKISYHDTNPRPRVFSQYDLNYHQTLMEVDEIDPSQVPAKMSQLRSVTRIGYDDTLSPDQLPPITFNYSRLNISESWPMEIAGSPKESLRDPDTTLLPFIGTACIDIVQTKDKHHCYMNRGLRNANVALQHKEFVDSPTLRLSDLATILRDVKGRGAVDLTTDHYYYQNPVTSLTGVNLNALSWGPYQEFDPSKPHPVLSPSEMGSTRAMDFNMSGNIDLLKTGQYDFTLWRNEGEGAWSAPETQSRRQSFGQKEWPDISFEDPSIFTADMNGDGLDELVRVSSRKVEYWSQIDGTWQFKCTMLQSPRFMRFEPKRCLVRDITGDGFSDLIYVDANRLTIFLNIGGHHFSKGIVIDYSRQDVSRQVRIPDSTDALEIVDFLGQGTKGVLWSFDRRTAESNYYFMPLNVNFPANLLTQVKNGIGGRIDIEYTTSAMAAVAAEQAGSPWESHLPFAAPLVSRVIRTDEITGTNSITEYVFRNGYYDRDRRRVLGFGMVEQIEWGDSSAAGTKVRHWYHNLDLSNLGGLDLAKARALSGREYRTEVFDLVSTSLLQETAIVWKTLRVPIWTSGPGGPFGFELAEGAMPEDAILFPVAQYRLEAAVEGDPTPRFRLLENRYEAQGLSDTATEFGTVHEKVDYGEVVDSGAGVPLLALNNVVGQDRTFFNYSDNCERLTRYEYATNHHHHIVDRQNRVTIWAGTNFDQLIGEERFYFDGGNNDRNDHLPIGEVEQGNLQRHETLWILEDKLTSIFSNQVLAFLGEHEDDGLGYYKKDTTASNEQGRFIVNVRNTFFIESGKIKYGSIKETFDARGSRMSYAYDDHKWLIRKTTNALGHKSIIEEINYRTLLPRIKKDPNNKIEKFEYDSFGRILAYYNDSANYPDPVSQYYYESNTFINNGAPTSIRMDLLIDDIEIPKRYIRSHTYKDGFNRVLQTCRSSEANNGNDFVVVSSKYNTKGFKYIESLDYHIEGHEFHLTDFVDIPSINFTYDALGRVIESRWSDGSFSQNSYLPWTTQAYDEEDVDPNSPHHDTPKSTYYDADQKPVRTVEVLHDALTGINAEINTRFNYNVVDLCLDIINDKNQVTSFDNSFNDKILRITNPDAGERLFMYDATGMLVFSRDARGCRIWKVYDDLSRIKAEVLGDTPSNRPDLIYQYDDSNRNAVGRPYHIQCQSENFEEWLDYDKRGNLTCTERQIDPTGGGGTRKTIATQYNTLNLPKSKNYDDGLFIVNNSYGIDGSLSDTTVHFKTTNNAKKIIENIAYHPSGAIDTIEFSGSGLKTKKQYSPDRLWVTNIKTTNSNEDILQDLTYSDYDKTGNIGRIDSLIGANTARHRFQYNSLYWLTEANFESPSDTNYQYHYDYDVLGNFTKNDEFNEADDIWYDLSDKPNLPKGISSNHDLFDYDDNGHVTKSDRLKNLIWNERGFLKSIKNLAENHLEDYYYSDKGIRTYQKIEVIGEQPKEIYYFDGGLEIRNGESLLELSIGNRRVARLSSDGKIILYLTNHLGNIDCWAKEDGTLDTRYLEIFNPYGNSAKEPTATDKCYRFAGGEKNDFDLYYFKARYYDARLGRFISPDPLIVQHEKLDEALKHFSSNFLRVNPSIYALNNPVIYHDPKGLQESASMSIESEPICDDPTFSYKTGWHAGSLWNVGVYEFSAPLFYDIVVGGEFYLWDSNKVMREWSTVMLELKLFSKRFEDDLNRLDLEGKTRYDNISDSDFRILSKRVELTRRASYLRQRWDILTGGTSPDFDFEYAVNKPVAVGTATVVGTYLFSVGLPGVALTTPVGWPVVLGSAVIFAASAWGASK